jgi:2-keto-4-pentenoate hydratase/2-oxohepta-3-ene-1,7-dioic acid hydratase in catechol pathway
MRLCTAKTDAGPAPSVLVPGFGTVPVGELLGRLGAGWVDHFERSDLAILLKAVENVSESTRRVAEPTAFDAPYRNPPKILGIGLNYGQHAQDLGADLPRESPASFIKGNHTIIGPGEPIRVPEGIGRVTAEAELGLVIGRRCYRVSTADALDYVAGVCAIIDMTAESVLLQNPRYLTRSKNYPSFFVFGPTIFTLDEIEDLSALTVSTVLNGQVQAKDRVSCMTFSPAELLSFHSHVMPMLPGDIIATGTPGAAPITTGDVVSCVLGDELAVLTNPVL